MHAFFLILRKLHIKSIFRQIDPEYDGWSF